MMQVEEEAANIFRLSLLVFALWYTHQNYRSLKAVEQQLLLVGAVWVLLNGMASFNFCAGGSSMQFKHKKIYIFLGMANTAQQTIE